MAARLAHALPFVLLLAACGDTFEKQGLTPVWVRGPEIMMSIEFYGLSPPDDADAEASRLSWLAELIQRNQLCPLGYTVVDRKVLYFGSDIAGRVQYTAQCRA